MSFMFNEICINEDSGARKYNSTLEYRRDLVKKQITLSKNNINTVKTHSHSSNMQKEKLHHFPDDGPKSGRKY